MKNKENVVDLIKTIITASRIFDFIENQTECAMLSASVNSFYPIIYLMGLDLDISFKQWDETTDRYHNIFNTVCSSELTPIDASHLLYSKFQTEIAKDLKNYPFLSVDYQEKKTKKAA